MHRAWGRILLIGAAGLGCLLGGIGVVIDPHLWVWPGLCVLAAIAGAAVVVLALELSNPASAPNGDLWMEADRLYTVRGAALAKIESTPEATPARCAKVTAWITELGFRCPGNTAGRRRGGQRARSQAHPSC
ncbi:hypothetical protein [Nonomuraea sp. NPDC049480]|uniref:hypothetical protein n=1 Tax=Nonomuraea sp. NPDC049480 TaxID=3364353 RepID=UPI0037BCD7E4